MHLIISKTLKKMGNTSITSNENVQSELFNSNNMYYAILHRIFFKIINVDNDEGW